MSGAGGVLGMDLGIIADRIGAFAKTLRLYYIEQDANKLRGIEQILREEFESLMAARKFMP